MSDESAPSAYRYDQRPNTHIVGDLMEVLASSDYAVLVGRNNSGKSFVLKSLQSKLGADAQYLGPSRLQNFNLLGIAGPESFQRKAQRYNQFASEWSNQQTNVESLQVNLQQAISDLSNDQRLALREIIKSLLGVDLEIKLVAEDNEMSQRYVSFGGHNLSYTSSGVRLITTIVAGLLDQNHHTVLIDEPELGISPEAQGILADFLFDRDKRAEYFPNLKSLVLATHSTIFLDRKNIANNYFVEKRGDAISLSQVASQADFGKIHFFLLGNRFETLYLPSIIVLVEGKCDHRFVESALLRSFSDHRFSVIPAHSDDKIKHVLHLTRSLLTDLQTSPYSDRIFAVLDSTHGHGLPEELVKMGLPSENVIVWPENGIEHFYPPSIVDRIFGVGAKLDIQGDDVSRNGVSYKKVELVEKIVACMDSGTVMHPTFDANLLQPIKSKLRLG